MTEVTYRGGRNIALKVPPHAWEATVAFYRDVLRLERVAEHAPDMVFAFGANHLWVDRVEALSQAEVWLEVTADDPDAAAAHLQSAGVVRRDDIEALPDGFPGFWVLSPASVVHLVTAGDEAEQLQPGGGGGVPSGGGSAPTSSR